MASTLRTTTALETRFAFGKNWARFLRLLNAQRIADAEESLCSMLEVQSLAGKSFLDIGSGSGLFSLAARRLGARVHSFDYDPQSVACTAELRRRFFPDDPQWIVEKASALDENYVRSLGRFDFVYSWGVLHHTGSMWTALEYAAYPVASGGKLFVAIYNDTGSQSTRWKRIKYAYNKIPPMLRIPFALLVSAPGELKAILRDCLALQPHRYLRSWTRINNRGMSKWHDIIDWVGGYPFEVAKPEEIFDFYRARGFQLTKIKCGGVGTGCNEFVFVKSSAGNSDEDRLPHLRAGVRSG